ncbi:SitI3 family protein [Winogradskya humida]|uniref:Uncharacterized protein n=1 Tax=Winogradskya humida TaxID=113566 RepID=A0ABQ4A4H9_9ACTN|nr:SitI3 family protein [Actinoplanes humidus]GIE25755.1 hypothetical protein Ahu01nite_088570 [Actinoplanes humidus]
MAIEYDLTLAGNIPVTMVAERALPDPDERPIGTPELLSIDLSSRYGFGVTILAGTDVYLDVETDQGSWEWEPDAATTIGFRLDKTADRKWAVVNMLTVVRRVLGSGAEDAALVLNGDVLVLARFDGVVVKHHRESWWGHYAGADEVIASTGGG